VKTRTKQLIATELITALIILLVGSCLAIVFLQTM